MGKKSNQKKNRAVNNTKGKSPAIKEAKRISLAELEGNTSTAQSQQKVGSRNIPNNTNISYEMMGNLHKEVRKILILLISFGIIIAGLYFANTKTDFFLKVGERAASFMGF